MEIPGLSVATTTAGEGGGHAIHLDSARRPVAVASPYVMFAHTEASQAKGMEFLGRFMERQEGTRRTDQ
jgi:hypothetical protein